MEKKNMVYNLIRSLENFKALMEFKGKHFDVGGQA